MTKQQNREKDVTVKPPRKRKRFHCKTAKKEKKISL